MNVRGLAHKIEWQAEYFYADSNSNLDALPLYNPLMIMPSTGTDHASCEAILLPWGKSAINPGTMRFVRGLPPVASPSDVIAGDLQQVRIGLHQRLQTKRGLPGLERIVDLFHLIWTFWFSDSDRDNWRVIWACDL